MIVKSAILLSGVLASSLAAQTVAPAKASAPAGGGKAGRKICRSMEATGSIFRTKTCRTQAEWAAIDARNTQTSRDFTDHLPPSESISPR